MQRFGACMQHMHWEASGFRCAHPPAPPPPPPHTHTHTHTRAALNRPGSPPQNGASKINQAISALPGKLRLLLTGTPIQNDLSGGLRTWGRFNKGTHVWE